MPPMLQVTPAIAIDENEISESFVRATGPGGQNVNKVSTAVMLRFDAASSPGLSEAVRARLAKLAGRRMTKEGVIVITAQRHASQLRNRAEALEALFDLIRRAAVAPVKRRATRPGRGAVERRLTEKHNRARIKADRRAPED